MTDFHDILYQVADGRARITLNRPHRHNAITEQMTSEIETALWEADDDTAVHSIIVRGAGRSFCSGYDLDAYGDHSELRGSRRGRAAFDDRAWQLEKMQRPLRAFHDVHKPIIAQVHGHCLAGGTGIAMFCDMVIVAEDANFGFPAARAGTLPNQMWLYSAGPQWTKRLTLTGDTISGADAARLGLAMKAVPLELLEAEVEGLADRLAHVDIDLLGEQADRQHRPGTDGCPGTAADGRGDGYPRALVGKHRTIPRRDRRPRPQTRSSRPRRGVR